jgi:hypothetical protein
MTLLALMTTKSRHGKHSKRNLTLSAGADISLLAERKGVSTAPKQGEVVRSSYPIHGKPFCKNIFLALGL